MIQQKEENVTFEQLYDRLKENYDESMLEEIKKAYLFACDAHKGEKRLTGEDYINHPVKVAYILSDLNVDYITIVAALLHETMNHADIPYETLENKFGKLVADIVNTISKINKLQMPNETESSAMYIRKVLVGLAFDIRVIYIKLADRLQNMRTIYVLPEEKIQAKAKETKMVLIPIAHRLGINYFISELENLCLYYTKKDVYKEIEDKLCENGDDLQEVLKEMEDSICQILIEHGIKFKIKSRVKSVYSIYSKLSKGKKWDDIYDILALRIILDTESDCYKTVGLIHAKYRPIEKRFKDYIAKPKENMYQSLHTGVYGIKNYRFEIQIRTFAMDEYAEKGNASHWSYKENGSKKMQDIMEQKLEIFRNMIETSNEDDNEFITEVNNEILNDSIYVYTPRGDVVELPKGATPIDFAYRIHSAVGDATIGAIVDDNIVPLDYKLEDGQNIVIKTDKKSTPSKECLNFVKTTQAKNKIKAFFSKQDKVTYTENGKDILERELRKRKLAFDDVLNTENLHKILTDLKLDSIDDLYFAIGSLRYTAGYIIDLTHIAKTDATDILLKRVRSNGSKFNTAHKNSIIVSGYNDIKVNIAKCCKPVCGDEIIGYITQGDGVSIHKKTCENIAYKNDRLIDVSWNNEVIDTYHTDLIIETLPQKNYLLDILQKASVKNVYIDAVKSKNYDNQNIYELTIKVQNKDEVDSFITDLNNFSFVKNVKRK